MSVAALPAALFPQQDAPLRGSDSQRLDSSSRRAASGKSVDDVDAPEDEREPKDDAANASPDAFNELLAGLLNVNSPQPVESPPVQEAAAETPAASSAEAVGEASGGAATNAAPTGATAINGANAQASAADSTSSAAATPADTPPAATIDHSGPQPEQVSDASMKPATAEANSSASTAKSESAAVQATAQDATSQTDENPQAPEASANGSASEEPRSESRTEGSSARSTSHPSGKPVAAPAASVEPKSQAPAAGGSAETGKVQAAPEVIAPAEKKAAPEKPAEVAHSTHELNAIEPVVQDVGASAFSAVANPATPVGTNSPAPIAADHVSRQVVQAILTHETDVTTLGQRSFEMMLDPPELGRLMIQMTRSSKGLEVKISAEDDAVGAILKASGADLQQSLQLSSLSLGQFGTPTQSSSESFTDSSADESPRGIPSVTRHRSFVPATSAGRSSGALNVIV
jgi:hypothetical protein